MTRILPVFGLLLLCCSCVYKPYAHQEYINTGANAIKPHTAETFLKTPRQAEAYMVGDVLLCPYMISTHTESRSHGPYGLGLSLYCLCSNSVVITSVTVASSLHKVHAAVNQASLPLRTNLKLKADALWFGEFCLPRQMDLSFGEGETVDITLEMTTNESQQPINKTYKFVPVLLKGRFQLID